MTSPASRWPGMLRRLQLRRRLAIPPWRSPWWLRAMGLGMIQVAIATGAAQGAERIYITYGPLERSIAISSLEAYARDGKIQPDLVAYTRYATPEQLNDLREILLARAQVGPVPVSQFLYTEQGEILLERLGEVIRTESRLSGFYAIRASLILAAADAENGLTPLNILQQFPLRGIRIDLSRALQIVSDLEQLINQTARAINTVDQQALLEASTEPSVNFAALPDLQDPGNFAWRRETIVLNDRQRDRIFPADLYLPLSPRLTYIATPAPVIILSHGLGTDRTTFAYLAEHLASYGFVVAVPEHPGSNAEQLLALINGRANEVTRPREFIDRPLDIKYLLDELDRLAQTDPLLYSRMDLQQVGIVGQSFGGYTALTVAGASVNLTNLAADCAPDDFLNLSLLLQCRALELLPPLPEFHDERIKAVIAINPIGSGILGPSGYGALDLPVMLVTGNADTVAPALPEQIRPFTWLTTPNKYLLLIRGATHFSSIGDSANGDLVPLPPEIIGPSPALARSYLETMSVAFFKTHLTTQTAYRPYLGAAYPEFISQPPLTLRLVQSLTAAQLDRGESSESASRRSPD